MKTPYFLTGLLTGACLVVSSSCSITSQPSAGYMPAIVAAELGNDLSPDAVAPPTDLIATSGAAADAHDSR